MLKISSADNYFSLAGIEVRIERLDPVTKRHLRAEQRRVASGITPPPGAGLTSRSHSRGIVAVAAAQPPVTRLGVDVEYTDPARPWADIVAAYAPETAKAPLGIEDCCRLWTFGEAYFKAFGAVPDPALLMRVARSKPTAPGSLDGMNWQSARLAEGFWLSLVWQGRG
jgi:hypothetical protein